MYLSLSRAAALALVVAVAPAQTLPVTAATPAADESTLEEAVSYTHLTLPTKA